MKLPKHIAELTCFTGLNSAQPVSGGLSNEIWHVTDAQGDHILRLGKDYPWHHVDRAREAMTTAAAHAAGFGPKLHHWQPGMMVTEYLRVNTWSAADVRANPERLIALLRRFHQEMPRHISGAAFLFWPFHVIRDYVRTLSDTRHCGVAAEALKLCDEAEAAQVPLPLVFGHNDLLPANILEDEARLWLVDYEYAGFSTPLFDLAGLASNAQMSRSEARTLLGIYYQEVPEPPLLRAFEAMQVAAMLREWLWALVSDVHLAAPGVDYIAYAEENRARLDEALARYAEEWGG